MKQNKSKLYSSGDKGWYVDGEIHRDGGPALEFANGDRRWCQYGKLHREDGPAIELADGDKYWYKNGCLHREDGPAIELANGQKYWYLNGQEITKLSCQPCNTQEKFEALMKVRAFW